jgi:hypothetical protein
MLGDLDVFGVEFQSVSQGGALAAASPRMRSLAAA